MLMGQRPIFSYGWASIPVLGYSPAWLSMRLFGDNLAGLNASGVLEGLLVIVGVYLLGRDLFHARVGLLAAALLTISYTHLAASRQAVYIDPVVFLVFAIYFLFVGLREDHRLAIVVSGLLTAFCALVYYPSRIIVFIVGAMLFYLLLFRRKWLWARGSAVLLWILAVLVTLGPMIVVFVQGFDAFMSRTREVFILSPDIVRHMQGVYHVNTIPAMLLEQAHRSVLIFHYYTDTSTQFGFARPFLDSFTAPLFTLGLGYALFHWRQFGHALVLTWTGLGVLIGCFLTSNPPFWARLMILLPPTILLAAVALSIIYEFANDGLARIDNRMTLLAPAATVLCLIVVGVLNWNTYVELKGTYATARTLIARYLEAQPSSARAYLVSQDFNYKDREFDFLVPGRLVGSLTPEQVQTELTPTGQPTLVILTPEQSTALQRLQQLFPNGSAETHTGNSPGEVAFYAFRLP
jgi:4-amino-4-deoxy-L-arabinose transferase-like glycosyltransferase